MKTATHHRLIRIAWLLGLAMLNVVVASQIASAQGLDVFGYTRPGPGDSQMIRERAQSLLDGPADPRALAWDNPRSGNSGSVILQREFGRQERRCRQIEYRVINRSQSDPDIFIAVWCKQANGRWMLEG